MEYNITYGSLVGAPVVVTLDAAKRNSSIEIAHVDDDDLLNILLDASVEDAEKFIETPIKKRNIAIGLTEWPVRFEMPVYPVGSITDIVYKDVNGADQTVQSSDYVLYSIDGRNKVKFTWDVSPNLSSGHDFPITINCVSGYTTEEMPPSIKSAVLMRFSHKERFREDVPTSYNRAFYAALRPFKLWK